MKGTFRKESQKIGLDKINNNITWTPKQYKIQVTRK